MLLHQIYPVVQAVNILCLNLTCTLTKKDWHPDYTVFIVKNVEFWRKEK